MIVYILSEAEAELADAIEHYEFIQSGLGIRLKEEVRSALVWISANPRIPRLRAASYRRLNLKVFPYYIAYAELGDKLWVLAIAHGHRQPEYWIQRATGLEEA